MVDRVIWIVWGGIFTDTRFETLEPGGEEFFGPFHDEATALRIWRDETRRKVDIASHRLFVMRAVPAEPGSG